jgi:tRNA(fMet)-specific endonuclease VapC
VASNGIQPTFRFEEPARRDACGDPTVSFDNAAAEAYGSIVASAGYSRRKLLDRMIAAQALVHRATLVTRNPEDFSDVPGLARPVW